MWNEEHIHIVTIRKQNILRTTAVTDSAAMIQKTQKRGKRSEVRRSARCATAQAVAGAGGSGEGGIGDRTEGTREENEDKGNSDHYRTQNHPGASGDREAGALALLSLGE
ncbi:hypothetical protein VTO73DRAFT_14922 [Trametes versicolor]